MKRALLCIYFFILIILSFIIFTNNKRINAFESKKCVSFTFDDGPSIYTKSIADLLDSYHFNGTFFEVGSLMKSNQDVVNYLIDLGNEVGNHSYSHKDLTTISIKEVQNEIYSTNILFNEITGNNIKLYRVPYGRYNDSVLKVINGSVILWSLDTRDWEYRDSTYIYNYVINNIEDGDIVLFHDKYSETLEALKNILPVLVSRGYRVVSVSELFNCYGIKLENKVYYNVKKHL